MAERGQRWINDVWYGRSPVSLLMLPLAWLFGGVAALRRLFFRRGLLRSYRVDVPVVVVGNLTAGGAGKTPVTLWLLAALTKRGIRPGVVSRGYGGDAGDSPVVVLPDSDPGIVGDEPLLIAQRAGCPVVVHPDRVAAARALQPFDVDIVISDDGLQHYRLRRDFEILVVDGRRFFGNGRLLPAGPLREPLSRIGTVDQIVVNGSDSPAANELPVGEQPVSHMDLVATEARQLDDSATRPLAAFRDVSVHAVAGIGSPDRFFDMLTQHGIDVTPHPLADHASPDVADVTFGDGKPVLMTEKDAVKCRGMGAANLWYVPVDVVMSDDDWIASLVALVRPQQSSKDDSI